MGQYALRRLLMVFPLLFGISVINYAIFAMAPGDPISAMMDPMEVKQMTPEELQAMREVMGLDKPVPVRYALWLNQAVRGNLGYSIWFSRPVTTVMGRALGNSIWVMVVALLISTFVGVSVGIVSALKPYSAVDYVATAFAFSGVAMPNFFFALLLIYVVSLQLGWLPTGGISPLGVPISLSGRLRHLILPAIALGYSSVGSLARYARSSMLEVMNEDYMRTARSKGLPESVVIMTHAFRNALLPVITVIGLRLPWLVGGSVLVETVFQYPGMGLMMVKATAMRDYPLLMGGTLLSAVIVLTSNLLTDLAYAWADPRIRYD